jgi:hypothetical protein
MKENPFLIERNFIPPLLCERIIGDLKIDTMFPTVGQDGKPKSTIFSSRLNTERILSLFEPTVADLEKKYNTSYLGTHNLMFEWYPTNYVSSKIKTDGYVQKRDEGWVRYNLIDFTGILWLNDYNDKPDFDPRFEVRGGQLEFPMFDINFQPERGTLVLFPTAPNFAHTVAPVQIGSLTQVRFQIRSETPYEFNKENFEMNPDNWNL